MEITLFQDVLNICVNHRESSIYDLFEANVKDNDIALAKIRSRKYRPLVDGLSENQSTRTKDVVTRLLKMRYSPLTDDTIKEAVKRYLKDPDDPLNAMYGPIEVWDTSSVTDMSSMFSGAKAFNGDLSSWDTSSVTVMAGMFYRAEAFNGSLSSWDTSSVTDMSGMFYGSKAFNGSISSWNTNSVTDMSGMFYEAEAFNGSLSSWDTSSVTCMQCMFYGSKAFNGSISSWDTSSVKHMFSMFSNATAFNGDISSWDTSSALTMPVRRLVDSFPTHLHSLIFHLRSQ
jgi:surface protein